MGVSNNANQETLQAGLATLTAYTVITTRLNSVDFNVPTWRQRLYMVGFRTDCLQPRFAALPQPKFQRFFGNLLVRSQSDSPRPTSFRQWLADEGAPIVPAPGQEAPNVAQCTCGIRDGQVCPSHPCHCNQCKKHGQRAMKCAWRQIHRRFQKSRVKQHRAYLNKWRVIKKDKKLK